MANTRTSTKRARQSAERQSRNQSIRSATRTVIRGTVDAFKKKENTAEALQKATVALSKAASKGAIPKKRAARKISRLARLAKKSSQK